MDGFETLDVVCGPNVDYVADAQKVLPFSDGTFEVVYASHVLEHIPWYQLPRVLEEWLRIVVPGGCLEVWVPDGLKICKAFVDAELSEAKDYELDGWYKYNEKKDPCIWACGRIFAYGDGSGAVNHWNWHRSLFSERWLKSLLLDAGCGRVEVLGKADVRGYDHGWINLGVRAWK